MKNTMLPNTALEPTGIGAFCLAGSRRFTTSPVAGGSAFGRSAKITSMKTLYHFVQLAVAVAALALSQPTKAATWTYTGSLKTATLFHTATLLPNGKVLVAGGQAISGITNRAELFDTLVGTWTNTGAMTAKRYVHTATLLLNGKVLVAGGFAAGNGGSPLSSAELFDPAIGTWTPTGSMTNARGYHVAILLANGKVLVAGGAASPSAEIYDPVGGTWKPTGPMSITRYGFAGSRLSS